MARRYVALDRDGTIIVERHYLSDPGGVELLPGVADGLRHLRELGLGLIVVTNQSAVGRGLFGEAQLARVHERLFDLLQAERIDIDGLFVCPHTPDDNCPCRKPRPGLLDRAAQELGFNAAESFVIGDKACDVELGQRVGATAFLARTGYGSQVAAEGVPGPVHIVNDVRDAARVIERLMMADARTTIGAA